LYVRWLHLFISVTDLSKRLGIHGLAACRKRELFWVYEPKTWKIFAYICAKMSKLTFVVGIKRRKIDEYRPEALSDDYRYRSGTDCFCRADCCTALIYPEGELSSSFSFFLSDCYQIRKKLLPFCLLLFLCD